MIPSRAPLRPAPRVGTAGAVLAGVLLAVPSCVHTRTVLLGETRYPARPPGHPIPIYDAVEDLPRPFEKVAQLRCEGGFLDGDRVGRLRAAAREAGADALVLERRPFRSGCGCEHDGVDVALAVRWR